MELSIKLIIFVAIVITLVSVGLYLTPIKTDNTVKKVEVNYNFLENVTVIIRAYLNDIERQMGSGVIIDYKNGYTYILTCYHVIKIDKNDIRVVDMYRERNAIIVAIDKRNDLAVIKIRGKLRYKKPIVGIKEAVLGEKAYGIGHHLGRLYIYGEGVVGGYDSSRLIVQLPCLFGDSGSGVFNKNGELIGIVDAVSVVRLNFAYTIDVAHAICIDVYDIKAFLDTIKELK